MARPLANALPVRMPVHATAMSMATREVALLTPEARPACASLTALMTVVVRGATLIAMPMLVVSTAGRTVDQ
jgi:hypothetical protein